MNLNYYFDYYNFERQHWWFRARKEILREYITANIASRNEIKILNVGAATGSSSEMLMEFGEVVSIEYEQACIDFVKEKIDFEIQYGSILELDFSDKEFDLVCAFDVIEHVEEDHKAVSEMLRVCKPGGHVLITVPALMELWSEHDRINHHFRRYELTELEAIFMNDPAAKRVFTSYFNTRLFPLVFLARKFSSLKGEKTLKSDFEKYNSGFLDNMFFRVFKGEAKRLKRKHPYQKGVSILAHYQSVA